MISIKPVHCTRRLPLPGVLHDTPEREFHSQPYNGQRMEYRENWTTTFISVKSFCRKKSVGNKIKSGCISKSGCNECEGMPLHEHSSQPTGLPTRRVLHKYFPVLVSFSERNFAFYRENVPPRVIHLASFILTFFEINDWNFRAYSQCIFSFFN